MKAGKSIILVVTGLAVAMIIALLVLSLDDNRPTSLLPKAHSIHRGQTASEVIALLGEPDGYGLTISQADDLSLDHLSPTGPVSLPHIPCILYEGRRDFSRLFSSDFPFIHPDDFMHTIRWQLTIAFEGPSVPFPVDRNLPKDAKVRFIMWYQAGHRTVLLSETPAGQ